MARKTPISKTDRAGFDRLVRHYGTLDLVKDALRLKSRQVVHSWGLWGIPKKHWDKIAAVTGMPINHFVPSAKPSKPKGKPSG